MSTVRVNNFSVSLDGYGAGTDQDLANPMGRGGMQLHEWVFRTRAFRDEIGLSAPSMDPLSSADDEAKVVGRALNAGATIMGRHMFGPLLNDADEADWTGWWGPNPPYHHPVFVLTHRVRRSIEMDGGTTFHFVDPDHQGGLTGVLDLAQDAAAGQDVIIGGGVATVRQFWLAGLIDDLHLAVQPILLGAGERLFDSLGDVAEQYEVIETVTSPAVMHVRFGRRR